MRAAVETFTDLSSINGIKPAKTICSNVSEDETETPSIVITVSVDMCGHNKL